MAFWSRIVFVALLLIVSSGAKLKIAADADAHGKGSISPVESVINLIEKLMKETDEEAKKDAASYDKFACFCKEQADEKLYSVEKATEKSNLLQAQIEQLTAEITALDKDVTKLNREIDDLKTECDDQQAARDKAFAAYVAIRDDLAGAIAGASEAIEMLSAAKAPGTFLEQKQTVAKTMLLVATAHGSLPDDQQNDKALESLLQLTTSEDPKASEFHSGAIIDMMKTFMKKFKNHKNEVDAAENDEKHTFDMAQAARKNQLKALEDTVAEESKQSAEKQEAKNAASDDDAKTNANKNADNAFLNDLASQCEQKAKDWDQRSSTRVAEMGALSKALGVLKGEVAGNYGANSKLGLVAKKQQPVKAPASQSDAEEDADLDDKVDGTENDVDSLLQTEGGSVSFLEKTSRKHKAAAQKAIGYLQKQAKALKSASLETLMMQMKEDHFVKVRTMIKDMIAKLEADASAEADQKAWCDEEMTKAMDQRDTNIGEIEGDTAAVTEAEAKQLQLTEEINTLMKENAQMAEGLKEATSLRMEEKADNEKTVTDSTAGLAGVTKAMQILKDFYDNAFVQFTPANAGADGQTVGDLAPDSASGEYHGNQDAASGIMGQIEVIKSDFERTIETVNTAESDAEEEFQNYKSDTESNIADKEDLIRTKTAEKNTQLSNKADSTDDLKDHTTLKEEALAELRKLKPACVSTGSDYAETVARREQEIESLKNAYVILDEMR